MNNHDHLFVETPDANLSAGMQFLNGSYTGYFNRRYRRSGQYRWSSYRGYHNPRRAFPWTTYEKVLGEFGTDPKRSRAAYRQFVSAGVEQKPASPFSQAFRGVILGREAFLERVREMLDDCVVDPDVPSLDQLRRRPSLEMIREAVAEKVCALAAVRRPVKVMSDKARPKTHGD